MSLNPLFLIFIGGLIIVLMAAYALRRRDRQRRLFLPPERLLRNEPIVDWPEKQEKSGKLVLDAFELDGLLMEPITTPTVTPKPVSAGSSLPAESLVVLHVMALPKQVFAGYELLQTLQALGLRYGPMNIFHRYDDDQIRFSVASATEPGIFDLDHIGGFSCVGLSLFMDMKRIDPRHRTDALEDLRETAQQLADGLGGMVENELASS